MVKSLADENPYDILGVNPDADKEAIKQAFADKSAGASRASGQDRRRLRQAFDLLRSVDERLIVDAFVPSFASDGESEQLVDEFCDQVAEVPDLLAYLDREAILREDLQALIKATLKCTFTALEEPQHQQEPVAAYDGLEDFVREWLG